MRTSPIAKLESRFRAEEARHDRAVKTLQKRCAHVVVAECPYAPKGYSCSALPEARVCLNCGLSEEGWGVGFVVLKKVKRTCSRPEYYMARAGLHLDEGSKLALLRKEVTLTELIEADGWNNIVADDAEEADND